MDRGFRETNRAASNSVIDARRLLGRHVSERGIVDLDDRAERAAAETRDPL